jgi:hypothetical protein
MASAHASIAPQVIDEATNKRLLKLLNRRVLPIMVGSYCERATLCRDCSISSRLDTL